MNFFFGNAILEIEPDFPRAEEDLHSALEFFKKTFGASDLASERVLGYIRENPFPSEAFRSHGMEIRRKQGGAMGARLFRISQELLRSLNAELYQALVEDPSWEKLFKVKWAKKGEAIIKKGDEADGVYYITRGRVLVTDENGATLNILTEGDIFGELAYFTKNHVRTANVTAQTDVVMRKVKTSSLKQYPALRTLLQMVAEKRELKQD